MVCQPAGAAGAGARMLTGEQVPRSKTYYVGINSVKTRSTLQSYHQSIILLVLSRGVDEKDKKL